MMMAPWKRVDVETPKSLDRLWYLLGAKAITLKPIGIFYKNGRVTPCLVVHESRHWADIPNPLKHPISYSWWYTSYVLEALYRWAANGFNSYPAPDHSKETEAYVDQWECQEENGTQS